MPSSEPIYLSSCSCRIMRYCPEYFSVSLDELLSNEELLSAAEADNKQHEQRTRDLVFGLLDCSMALFFVLPIFGQTVGADIQEVSLLGLTQSYWYIIIPYHMTVLGQTVLGILTLAMQNSTMPLWVRCKSKLSLGLSVLSTLHFILSTQPYAAQFTFIFLMIKVLMLIKWT